MITVTRRAHPGLQFDVGSMTALDLTDGVLGGIVAWYSIIHTPPQRLPGVFTEFHRVLGPGGHLLLAFQVGDERVRLEQAYGHTVSPTLTAVARPYRRAVEPGQAYRACPAAS